MNPLHPIEAERTEGYRQRTWSAGPHRWVAASLTPLDDRQARHATRRGSVRLAAETKIEALEVYCHRCRRPYEEVAGQECLAGEHLIGGPIGTRQRRRSDDEETLSA